jgi:PTS system mannose-specific IIB component/fructoselysine and glucoselysine-specific PTS system IIB component
MTIALYRIDDRLVHGQVVVGWGQPLDIAFLVLVDDTVAASDWEQDLYKMGTPPEMELIFASVDDARARLAQWQGRTDPGILLTADVATMQRLVTGLHVPTVNLGGVHHRAGRTPRLRYVFLTPEDETLLRAIAAEGVFVTAQDVPAATPIPLEMLLTMHEDS